MKKRLLSIALATCMLLTLLPTTALAGVIPVPMTIEINGTYHPESNTISDGTEKTAATLEDAITADSGDASTIQNLKITAGTVTEDDWAYIKSLTALEHFEIAAGVTVADMPDTTYTFPTFPPTILSVNIPQAISIGAYAYAFPSAMGGSAKLTTVSLPEVTAIGTSAFYNCAKLTAVSLPEATEIRDSAFSKCTNLATVSLPKVTKLGTQAFLGCRTLTEVSLPEVTEIGDAAFHSCVSLTTVSLPKVTSIGDSAFYSSALATLKIAAAPPTIETDAVNAAKTNPLVLLAEDGSELTGTALTDAQDLYKAVSDGDTADGLWYGWTIAAPATAPTIAEIAVPPDLMTGADLNAVLTAPEVTENGFAINTKGWVTSADGITNWQNVPVNSISSAAMNGHYLRYYVTYDSGTKIVYSPNTVQLTINRYAPAIALTATPDSPQSAGTAITLTAALSGGSSDMSNQNYLNTVPVTFKDGGNTLGTAIITAATGKATYSFTPASGSHSFTAAFPGETDYNTAATSAAVSYVVSADPITIETGGTYVSANNTISGGTEKGGDTLQAALNGVSLTSVQNLKITAGTVTEADWAYIISLTALQHFEIASEVTVAAMPDVTSVSATFPMTILSVNIQKARTIGAYAFNNCKSLTTVSLPEVMSIGDWAFYNCQALTTVSLPEATAIGKGAFSCDQNIYLNLKKVSLPKVMTIGEYAFYRCEALTTVSLPEAAAIGKSAFNFCKALTTVSLPKVTTIGEYAFHGCTGLTTVSLPEAIAISIAAFNDCKALTTVSLPKVTTIDQYAFLACSVLATLKLGATPPPTMGSDVFKDTLKKNPLVLLDASGAALSGAALTTAQDKYKAVSDGNATDGLWYGWTIAATLSDAQAVAAAKAALSDGTVTVAAGANQAAKTAAVQAYVNGLLTGDATGVTATVTYNSGTGKYDVALTKGSVNDSKSLSMTVNESSDPNAAIVAAAKAALSDGTVTVASGADQTAKTAAVQTYVNSLLTGDAAGVTATVTYNSGTGKYDVALSKGAVKDSKSLSMTVNESSDPNAAIVAAAKTAAENANYADMTQAEAPNANAINAALKATAEAAVGNNGVTVTVNQISYTAPIAGTAANPGGTNGTYTFTITVSKDGQSAKTEQKTITITATALPTYNVGGNVTDSTNTPLENASVKLMLGRTQVGATATTDGSGAFTISGIPNGTYNLVVSKDGIVVTSIITVSNANYAAGTITLPAGKTNSVVEVKDNTPAIVVGKLDTQFGTTAADNDKGVTGADQSVVTSGGSVELKLTAEERTSDSASYGAAIMAVASTNGNTVGIYLDLSVVKTVTPNAGSPTETILTELPGIIEVRIPLAAALQGKSAYVVYRYHGSAVDTITTAANADGEKIELADGGATIILTVRKFSTYAVSYTPAATGPTGGTGGSAVSGTITAGKSDNGSITIGADKKSAVITPDDGYVIADVLVDGKSVGATEKYTFADSGSHKISAVFVSESALPYYLQNGERLYIGFSVITGKLYKYLAPAGVSVLFAENPKSFTDNTIAWAKPGIDFVTERELFLGTGPDSFSPNASMTRGMFVAVIGRLYERSYGSVSGTGAFSDVPQDAYYAKYVAWASENGIVRGIGESKFAPGRKITREQMAAILLNFAVYLQKAEAGDEALRYPDSAEISAWAVDGAKFCQQTQVIMGRADGSFAPKDSATRAEVAAVITRFIKTIVN